MKHKLLNFKNIIAAILVTALISTSCKKYLSPEPLSSFDPSVAFGNIPNAKASLMGAYLSMAGDFGYGIRVSYYYAYDDDAIMGGGSGTDQLRHQEAHYLMTTGNSDIGNTFNQFYSGIERANNCIYYIPKMPQYTSGSDADKAELQRMYGEALTIRAQLYYEIVRIWGDVPAQFVPSSFIPDLFLPRTERDTIYAHILNDLALAKTLMPWRTAVAQDERFTKASAMALRAKVALFRGGYSLRPAAPGDYRSLGVMRRNADYLDYYKIAKTECEEIIASGQHGLMSSFKSLWKDVVDAHKAVDPAGELIMQVAMANGTNSDSKIGAQSGTKINGVGGSLGNMLPTYFYQFDSTDVRRDVTVVPFEVVRDVFGRGHASNSIYDGKFRRDWITNPSFYMSNGITSGTNPVTLTPASNASIQNFQLNWPLIRYADVLLMQAEADNEINNGPTAAAIANVKAVSLRGHGGNAALVPAIPTDKDGFFKFIIRERGLEFGGEGIRKYDLIRWNLLSTAIAETRTNLTNMALGNAMVAPSYMAPPPAYTLTNTLPQFMYYYQNAPADDNKIWANSFYKPTPATAPLDPTNGNVLLTTTNRVAWFKNANITTTYVNYYGLGFTLFPTGRNELYPIPSATLSANYNLTGGANPGY
jgi:SusD family.